MTTAEVNLTDLEHSTLRTIARQTGKSEAELLHEAVQQYLAQFQHADRRSLLQQARGMWRDRTDLPSTEELRREFDRQDA
jgi:hypothetical protein